MTVTDTAGNPTTVSITFPMVAKGDQKLTDFSYTPSTVTFGDPAPTVIAPTGAVTTVSYAATPPEVCTVNATSGALTLAGVGDCVVTATAEATDNYNLAAATATVTVRAVGTLALNLDAIAGDDTVNLAEKTTGFTISGNTGSESDVSVSVTIGSQSPLPTTSDVNGAWVVSVPQNAAYLTGTSVTVTVSATKTGFTSPSPETRDLTVDLSAPSATYTPPATLQVGVAIADMTPSTTATDIDGYSAAGLPPGLSIDDTTGDISGTPDTANDNPATATVTVTDTAGNPTDVPIAFPAVAKGDQPLTGFSYSPETVTLGDAAPTVTAPTRAQTTVSYTATPADVCTVNATSGALTLVGMGDCVVTATAEATDNYNLATLEFTVTVRAVGTLALSLAAIAGDDTVNVAEHAAGFPISGDTGTEADVSVSVTIGSQSPVTATSAANGAWVVTVPANATYITGTSVTVTVSATKAGFTAPSDVTRTLAVDLSAPSATYTPPATLQVGVAIVAMMPSTTATDIASYAATGLPLGLSIDDTNGDITGTPDTANPATAIATVTVTDNAGNPTDVPISFPMVATFPEGDQTLTGFDYSPDTVTLGDAAPTVTAPTRAQTTVSYTATPAEVCTVNATSGALTLVGMGDCVVTATAEATDNYNLATLEFTVTVRAVGTLALSLAAIAGDDTVNVAEHAAGFPISGDTGTEADVSVSVTIGSQSPVTATSAANGAWVVNVPPNAAYITGTSVTVTVSATKAGFTAPSDVTRTLAVDLSAPSANYTPPDTLQVGVALTAMTPSTTATDIASYGATGLPSGLSINSTTGVISGTPDIADPTTATATVTVTDNAGNPATVSITFPMVAKGDQKLTDFSYTPSTVMFGDAAPTVTAPTGALTTVSYTATPPAVCTVNATSGALTLAGMGDCVVTATAEATDNYNDATLDFTVTVQAVGTLALNLAAIATDDTVNIAEKTTGFTISGNTGSESDVSVSVTIGSQSPLTATSAANGAWVVSVPPNAAYIIGTSVTVTVSATKTGFTSPSPETRDLTVDLSAPSATYTPPATLQVGVAIVAMMPSTTATDIASYAATGLPRGWSSTPAPASSAAPRTPPTRTPRPPR